MGSSRPAAEWAAARARRASPPTPLPCRSNAQSLNGESGSTYITPPYGLRADGPLMTGACVGAASGAGIRFWKTGICGAGDPSRVLGSRTKPPRNPPPCPSPPRAKPGVDATTKAVANTAAKMRFMVATPSSCAAPRRPSYNHPRATTFNLRCFALIALAFIVHPTAPLMSPTAGTAASKSLHRQD